MAIERHAPHRLEVGGMVRCAGKTAGTNRRLWATDGIDARSKPSRKIDGRPGRHCAAYVRIPCPCSWPGLPSPPSGAHPKLLLRASSTWKQPVHFMRIDPCFFSCSAHASLSYLRTTRIPSLRLTVLFLKVEPQIRPSAFVSLWNITASDGQLQLHMISGGR